MELEETHQATNGNNSAAVPPPGTNGCTAVVGTPPTSTTIIEEEFEMLFDGPEDELKSEPNSSRNGHQQRNEELEKGFEKYLPLIELGQQIAYFANSQLYESPSPLLRKRMNDAFSLICSPCPYISDNSYLLEPKQRYIVAKALNSAIQEMLGKENSSQVDKYIRKGRHLREKAMPLAASSIFTDVDQLIFTPASMDQQQQQSQM